MLQQEFEEMVGKEVSYDTFRMYEAMYMACPESVTKQEFVKLLNIEAIPESEEAIERRKKAEEFDNSIKARISEIKEILGELKVDLENRKWRLKLARSVSQPWEIEDYKCFIKKVESDIKAYKIELQQLEWVIA